MLVDDVDDDDADDDEVIWADDVGDVIRKPDVVFLDVSMTWLFASELGFNINDAASSEEFSRLSVLSCSTLGWSVNGEYSGIAWLFCCSSCGTCLKAFKIRFLSIPWDGDELAAGDDWQLLIIDALLGLLLHISLDDDGEQWLVLILE